MNLSSLLNYYLIISATYAAKFDRSDNEILDQAEECIGNDNVIGSNEITDPTDLTIQDLLHRMTKHPI